MTEQCKNCKFWAIKEAGSVSECRIHAPTMIKEDGIRVWPQTYAIDWCADYQRDYKTGPVGSTKIAGK